MTSMQRYLYSLLFLSLILEAGLCQHLGVPFVSSYSKLDYGFGTQNWNLGQDTSGVMYFANNDGLLKFDGHRWTIYRLPNKTICRSILVTDSVIYAGGQNEFGRFISDPQQGWKYESLRALIPQVRRSFEDVWEIAGLERVVYFRSQNRLYIYDGAFTVLEDRSYAFLQQVGQKVIVQEWKGPLFEVAGQQLTKLQGSEQLATYEISGIVETDEGYLIATQNSGLFILTQQGLLKSTDIDIYKLLSIEQVNCVTGAMQGDIVLGTSFGGIIVLDKDLKLKYQLAAEQGLLNNKVIDVFCDRNDNIWCGLDNGIGYVLTSYPFHRVNPDGALEGAGYDAVLLGDKLYFGTSNGVYYIQQSAIEKRMHDSFEMVPGTQGQVWGLDVIDDVLFLSHSEGGAMIKDNQVDWKYREGGMWLLKRIPESESLLVGGTYEGLAVFDRKSFEFLYKIPGYHESSRFLEFDALGHCWIGHPYRGIYRVNQILDTSSLRIDHFGVDSNLPSDLHNHVFRIADQVIICGERGSYLYNEALQSFTPYEDLDLLLDTAVKTRRLFEEPTGSIWYVQEGKVGLLEKTGRGISVSYENYTFPELSKMMNGGWEMVSPISENWTFIATTEGFLRFDRNYLTRSEARFDVLINEVSINSDGLIYSGLSSLPPEEVVFSKVPRSILFRAGATEFNSNSSLRFSYFLQGFDEDWSVPTELRSKEYTGLGPGDYQLSVRAFSSDGGSSDVRSFAFSILRPWYRTYFMLSLFTGIFISVSIYIFMRYRNKFSDLKILYDTTVERSQAAIQSLEREKITNELEFKNRELISATMRVIHKNDQMEEISHHLGEIAKAVQDSEIKGRIRKLLRKLKSDNEINELWDQFMLHFNEVHHNFFDRLKQEYPDLTAKDLKICVYLKMNLSTKEIATLMGVSIRGVEASRYRLRKKICLPTDQNLNEFLMSF